MTYTYKSTTKTIPAQSITQWQVFDNDGTTVLEIVADEATAKASVASLTKAYNDGKGAAPPVTPPPVTPPPVITPPVTPPQQGTSIIALLAGPYPSSAAVKALGGVYAKYENDFVTYGESHWKSEGAQWDNAFADYYDRAKIWYMFGDRSSNQTYLDRGDQMAVNYRDNYLIASNYGPAAHWEQMEGVAIHYLRTHDEKSRTAVGKVADLMHAAYYQQLYVAPGNDGDARIMAKTLQAFVYAAYISAPSDQALDWKALATDAVNRTLAQQGPDGVWRFPSQGSNVVPFMMGLLGDALIDYYLLINPDTRIPVAMRKMLDTIWSTCKTTNVQGNATLLYVDKSYNVNGLTGDPIPAPDLNNLITSSFGFVYATSKVAAYKTNGEALFAGGVNAAFVTGSKQFNQEYATPRFLYFRAT